MSIARGRHGCSPVRQLCPVITLKAIIFLLKLPPCYTPSHDPVALPSHHTDTGLACLPFIARRQRSQGQSFPLEGVGSRRTLCQDPLGSGFQICWGQEQSPAGSYSSTAGAPLQGHSWSVTAGMAPGGLSLPTPSSHFQDPTSHPCMALPSPV